MKVCFLVDENLSPRLKTSVLNLNPTIDIIRVGEINAPALATLDPDILSYLELSKRLLVTDNRKSMPGHLEQYWAEGGTIWGLFWVRPGASLGEIAEAIYVVWEVSEAEEWLDRLDWIPF
ncbi:MAG: DUF5615 family PIN-like protein [Spirulinaceae cyanobacterium]